MASETGNMIRRSLESKITPKHLSVCMQCYNYLHDTPGETSAFAFEHMCDGADKNFAMLHKAKLILLSLPVENAEQSKEAGEAKQSKVAEEAEQNKVVKVAKKSKVAEGVEEIEEVDGTVQSKEADGTVQSKEAEGVKESKKS